jgi:hypothetical protein
MFAAIAFLSKSIDKFSVSHKLSAVPQFMDKKTPEGALNQGASTKQQFSLLRGHTPHPDSQNSTD